MDPNPPQALYHLVRCPGQDKELLPGLITDPQSALMFQLVAPVMSSGGSSEGASEAQLVPQCQTLSCVLGGGQATLRQHSEECQIVNINISTFLYFYISTYISIISINIKYSFLNCGFSCRLSERVDCDDSKKM